MAPIFEDDLTLEQHLLNPNNETELEKIITILKKFPSIRTKAELKSLYLLLQEIDFFADFFKEMPDITCLDLLKSLKYENIQKGQTLFNIGDNERYSYLILKGSVFTLVPKTRTYLDLNQIESNSDLPSDAGGSPTRSEVRSLTFSPKRKNEGSFKPSFGQKEALTSAPQLYTLKDIPECEPFGGGGASLEALSPLRRNGIMKNLTVAVSKTEKSYTKLASLNLSNAAVLAPEEVSSYHSDYRVASMFESGSFFGKPALNPNIKRDIMIVTRESCVFLIMDIRSFRQIKVKHEEQVYQETLEFFKTIPLTKEWTNMSLINLLRQCKTLHLTKNNVVYNIGDPIGCVYFIKQGEIEIVKDATIELDSNELLPRQDINNRGTLNFDRINMLSVNSAWKRKFNQKHTQQVKVALISANQTFGEEEFAQKKPTRQFRAIVKSSSAELLYVSFTKLIENAKNPEKFLEKLSTNSSKSKWRQSFETDVVEITQNNPSADEMLREKEAKKKPYINLFNVSGFKMQDAQDRKSSIITNLTTHQTSEDLLPGTPNNKLVKQKDNKRGSTKDLNTVIQSISIFNLAKSTTTSPKSLSPSKGMKRVATSHIFTEGSTTKTTAPGSILHDVFTPKRGNQISFSPRISPIKSNVSPQNMSPNISPSMSPENSFIINKGGSRMSTYSPFNLKPKTASAAGLNFSSLSQEQFEQTTTIKVFPKTLVSSTNLLFTEEKQVLKIEDGYDPKILHTKLGLSRILNEKPKTPSHNRYPAHLMVKSPTMASMRRKEELVKDGSFKDMFTLLNAPKIKVNNASPKVIISIKKKMKSHNNSLSTTFSQALFPPQFSTATAMTMMTTSEASQSLKKIPKESVTFKKSQKKRANLSVKIDRKFNVGTLESVETQMQDFEKPTGHGEVMSSNN